MNCPTCANAMRPVHNQEHFHCISCNEYRFATDICTSADPITPQGSNVEADCPQCHIGLQLGVLHDRWNVCYCEGCRGFLIESGMFQVITHEMRQAYRGPDDQPRPMDPGELDCQRECPACLERFETHPYFGPGNVVIDSCRGCELTWLDHGELAMIIRAPGRRPSPNSSPVVPTYTHIPTDAVGMCTVWMLKRALRMAVVAS